MSYQALLFYSDEKTARVLMQVLDELDFSVEPDSEPFAAVKTLMLQRFDIIIVDCEDEQNASLLFKSARNSETNNDAVAIAITTGQAGIAHAFRLGASLILTKPINVEQVKSTLRTARAALRKAENHKAAAPATARLALKAAAGSADHAGALSLPSELSIHQAAAPAKAPVDEAAASIQTAEIPLEYKITESAAIHPAGDGAPATAEARSAITPVEKQPASSAAATGVAPAKDKGLEPPSAKSTKAVAIVPKPPKETEEAASSPAHSAKPETAPLSKKDKEKESARKEKKNTEREDEKEAVRPVATIAKPAATPAASAAASASRFASLGIREKKEEEENFDPAKSTKNFWIAAIIVLVLAGAGYYAWMQLHPAINLPFLNNQSSAAAKPAKPPQAATPKAPAAASQSDAALPAVPGAAGSPPADAATTAPANSPAQAGAPKLSTTAAPGTPTTPGGPAVLSEDVSRALVIRKVQPAYPEDAKQTHLEGSVHLQVSVNPAGSVTDVKVLSGNAILAKAAIAAVKQWKYQPYYQNGQASAIETQATLDFKLP